MGVGRCGVALVVGLVLVEMSSGGAPPGMVWDAASGWVPESAAETAAAPAGGREGMMTLGGEDDLLAAPQRRGLPEASELTVDLAKESMLEVSSGGLTDQEALEAAVVAEAIAAPLIGANGEDRSVPAPREDSGAGRRDDVRAPTRLETEEFVPSAGEIIPGADMMPQEEDPKARAVKEETEAAMAAQQDALDAAKAKIDRLHAALAEGKAPVDRMSAPPGASKTMKRVTGGRTPVGDMDANRAALLSGNAAAAATAASDGGDGDSMDPAEARLIQEQVQAKREEAMLMREMARSRFRRGSGGDDISPMERDQLRQQARAEERRQPGWDPSQGYGKSAEERLAQARASRDRIAPPPLSDPPPPSRPNTAGAAQEGVWYQVDGGGAVAFRSKPEKNARTKVVAEAHTLVYAVADPAAPEGWIKTNTELWLPTTYLIGPLGDRDGPSVVEAAEAHATHAALAAAEGYVRGPVTPPPASPPAPAPEPSWATGCVDSDWKCNLWAANGECETDAEFMAKKCRLACGLCTPTESERATDDAGTAVLEDLYAKAKAELPPSPPLSTEVAAASVEGATTEAELGELRTADAPPAAAASEDVKQPLSPPRQVPAPDGTGTEDEAPAVAAMPKLKTIRRGGSSASSGSTHRRTLSSRPTKLVTKSPSLKEELARTRQAIPKVEAMALPVLKRNQEAAATACVDDTNLPSSLEDERAWLRAEKQRMQNEGVAPADNAGNGADPSDLPSSLEEERAWLQAEKLRLQKEQDDVARALAEAGEAVTMGMGMGSV